MPRFLGLRSLLRLLIAEYLKLSLILDDEVFLAEEVQLLRLTIISSNSDLYREEASVTSEVTTTCDFYGYYVVLCYIHIILQVMLPKRAPTSRGLALLLGV
jgi:hypothetical protein